MKRGLHLVLSRHYESDQDDIDGDGDDDDDDDNNKAVHQDKNNGSSGGLDYADNDEGPLKSVPRQIILVDHHHNNNNNNALRRNTAGYQNSVASPTGRTTAADYQEQQQQRQRHQNDKADGDGGYDQELENQTLDFLTDRLLHGSVFFSSRDNNNNQYPERSLPHFSQADLVLGKKLGGGEFGKVYTVESFNQRQQNIDCMPGAIVMDGGGEDCDNRGSKVPSRQLHSDRHNAIASTPNQKPEARESSPVAIPQISEPVLSSSPRLQPRHSLTIPLGHSSSEDRCLGSSSSNNKSTDQRMGKATNAMTDDSMDASDDGNPSSSLAVPFARPESSHQCGYYYSVDDMSDLDDDGEEDIDRARKVDEKRRYMIHNCHRQGEPQYAIKVVRRELRGWKRYMATIDMACELKFLAGLSHPNIIQVRGLMGFIGRPEHFGIILDRLSYDLTDKIDEWRNRTASLSSQPREKNHKRRHSSNTYGRTEEKHHRQQDGPGSLLGRLMHGRSRSVSPSIFFTSNDNKRHSQWDELLTERIMACYDIARAMRYLHQRSILFRDLKPNNVGVTLNGTYVLFDMGLTVELKRQDLVEPPDGYAITGLTGSRMFMAPENALCRPYGYASDSYSFAMLMWEVVSMELAFGGWDLEKHWQRVILGGERPCSLSHILPPALDRMMQDAWNENPSFRLTFESICEIMKTEIIERVDCDEAGIVIDNRTEYLLSSKPKEVPLQQKPQADDVQQDESLIKPSKPISKKKHPWVFHLSD
mmetsp:Transcript_25929/g.61524  ORF Transcript_25929/g.61524 Transcript_25929/m.61524 type:complete len:759 (-) Transcript_25929:605-2881(-)